MFYTWMIKNIKLPLLKKQSKEAIALPLYSKLEHIPFNVFVNIYCYGDLTLLSPNKKISSDILANVWDEIHNEYLERIGGTDYTQLLSDVKVIYSNETIITHLGVLLDVLDIVEDESIYNMLFTYDIGVEKIPYTNENYIRIKKRIVAKMKMMAVDIITKTKDLDKKEDNEKPNKEIFYEMIAELIDTFKVSIDINKITMLEYCIYVKKYKSKVDFMQKNINKDGK